LANIIRYRGEREDFLEAFDTILSSDYVSENEDLTLVACGPIVAEAMRAAYILKEEYNIETRMLNFHTVNQLIKKLL